MENPRFGTHRGTASPTRPPSTPSLTGVPKVGQPAVGPLTAPALLAHAPLLPPAPRVQPPAMPLLHTTSPNMPTLPAVPARTATPGAPVQTWVTKAGPSAALVQQQYVDLRLAELETDRRPGRQAALRELEQLLLNKLDPGKKRKIPAKELLRVYGEIERNLQAADLTVNFLCSAWFSVENTYSTYTQMYERAVDQGQMVLKSTGMNDATARAEVDNRITFPATWQGQATAPQRGLRPGPQGAARLAAQMDTGQLIPMASNAKAFTAANKHFNPKTKQIFLGLNYGRRPHGSARNFGWSYFVLKDSLKKRCFFYAGDTFMQLGQGTHAGNLQVTYDNLGALFGKSQGGDVQLRDHIYQSCYEGRALSDLSDQGMCKFYLIEAHHFGELSFAEHIDYMVLSPMHLSTKDDWPTIVENARRFARKHGFPLYQTT